MSDNPASVRPAPGTLVVFRWRKWDGSPHWEHDCVFLGSDEWGDWVGQLEGWRSARPGKESPARTANVSLIPPSGKWCYTRNLDAKSARQYIDVAWDVYWDDGAPVGIDMDLDVVRRVPAAPFHDPDGVLRQPGDVYIEDRGEFDEHRVRMGYPLHIVQELEEVAADLEQRVRADVAPFDDATAQGWFDRLTELTDPHRING